MNGGDPQSGADIGETEHVERQAAFADRTTANERCERGSRRYRADRNKHESGKAAFQKFHNGPPR